MDIIKTILKLSFFILGCVMLGISFLMISVGFDSFIWFIGFSCLFYLLSYQYTLVVIKWMVNKIKNLFKLDNKNKWVDLRGINISYNHNLKMIKLNNKNYNYDQIVSIDLIANSKKVTVSELKKLENIKKLEVKIGTKVKKIVYRHFNFITGKISDKNKKIAINSCIRAYKKLKKVLKNQKIK